MPSPRFFMNAAIGPPSPIGDMSSTRAPPSLMIATLTPSDSTVSRAASAPSALE